MTKRRGFCIEMTDEEKQANIDQAAQIVGRWEERSDGTRRYLGPSSEEIKVHVSKSRDTPFDRVVLQSLRAQADEHIDDPYGRVPFHINWLWFARMVATMEANL